MATTPVKPTAAEKPTAKDEPTAKDGERPAFDTYPDRPYWEAVDPAAFPDGLPPEAVAPEAEEPFSG